ncbi:hypothetical protein EC973_005444 [Apophysomyces ossiformis]|uniref:Tetraspanin n=1 Tax=Apophysomyces ossiformis TaxID=679940 RepID=A0A8H7ESU4_9FUNG|nr:hypothetical protein EC973_005444 [Apophysomyces ossiformis]
MTTLSKVYIFATNLLFACLGIAFIAFGLIGNKDGFIGASLFPTNTFKLVAILGAVICVASIFGAVGAFTKRAFVTYIYLIIVVIALVFQVVIGVKIYQKAANPSQYMAPLWNQASTDFRAHLQAQFSCCGFNNPMDNPAISDTCNPQTGVYLNPCYYPLTNYVRSTFGKVYLVIFAALAVELLAISNGITQLCTRSIYGDGDDEDERRRRRKSGIRLDDMSPDTPTTAGSTNHFGEHKYYAADGHSMYSKNNNSQYDNYDGYRQNNGQNYGDNYNPGKYY